MTSQVILIPLLHCDENQVGGETIEATRIRDDIPEHGVWRLEAVPLFANLHFGDVVICQESDDTIPKMVKVLECQPLVTVHLLFTPKGYRRRTGIVAQIEQGGFHVEQVEGKLWVINADIARLGELNELLARFPQELRSWQDDDTPDAR